MASALCMPKYETVPDAPVVLVAALDSLLGHDPAGVMMVLLVMGGIRLEARGAVHALLRHHAPVPGDDLAFITKSRIISFINIIKKLTSFKALS